MHAFEVVINDKVQVIFDIFQRPPHQIIELMWNTSRA